MIGRTATPLQLGLLCHVINTSLYLSISHKLSKAETTYVIILYCSPVVHLHLSVVNNASCPVKYSTSHDVRHRVGEISVYIPHGRCYTLHSTRRSCSLLQQLLHWRYQTSHLIRFMWKKKLCFLDIFYWLRWCAWPPVSHQKMVSYIILSHSMFNRYVQTDKTVSIQEVQQQHYQVPDLIE